MFVVDVLKMLQSVRLVMYAIIALRIVVSVSLVANPWINIAGGEYVVGFHLNAHVVIVMCVTVMILIVIRSFLFS